MVKSSMEMEANVQCALKLCIEIRLSVVSSLLSLARYLLHQVLWQLPWRWSCIKQTELRIHELHAQTHLHATVRDKNTVITKTQLMPLLVHSVLHASGHITALLFCCLSQCTWSKKTVMHAMTFEIIHFFVWQSRTFGLTSSPTGR